jgi:hypothetical protein
MFCLCLFVWAIAVDNLVLPSMDSLHQDVGAYNRYRVKEWSKGKKWDFISDELLVYAIVKNREQLYYIDYTPQFEATLKYLPQGTPVQLRYVRSFPKFWKRHLYDMRSNGISVMSYSPGYMIQKQKEIWKITGIMGGVYLIIVVLGFLNKPRPR